jgi:hypothetical protein
MTHKNKIQEKSNIGKVKSQYCPTEHKAQESLFEKPVDAKCAPGAKHTASRTKLASHAQRITRRASQIFLKINKR